MEIFRTGIQVACINIYRWKKDYRIWLIFAFTMLLIIWYMQPYIDYCMKEDKTITFCLLPLLYVPSSISIGAPKMMWNIGFIILLCDAPFMHEAAPYVFIRGGRKSRFIGECMYIIWVAFIYMLFITFISMLITLPVINISNDWGDGISDYIFGSNKYIVSDLVTLYPRKIPLPEQTIKYLYPFAAEVFTFFSSLGCMIIMGLLLFFISMLAKRREIGMIICGIFVMLDPILTWIAEPNAYYLQSLSPICWTSIENLNILKSNYFLSISFVIMGEAVCIILLLIAVYFINKKSIIEVKE